MAAPQAGQVDGGLSSDKPAGVSSGSSSKVRHSAFQACSIMRGRRRLSTLRKLPTSRPSTATVGISSAGLPASKSSMERS
jgi:hypothetical protein